MNFPKINWKVVIIDVALITFFLFIFLPIAIHYDLKNSWGVYFQVPKSIGINMRDNLSMDDLKQVTNHEIGHYIWYNCLNDSTRKEYTELYDSLNSDCREYQNNAKEDFAESYSNLRLADIDFFRECADKWKFFRRIYFEPVVCG